jgi:serine/threonine protein kinase
VNDSLLVTDLEIDRIVGQFEQALRRGEDVRIEDVSSRHSALGIKLVSELVLTEVEYRRSRRLPVNWDDYAARFPDAVTKLRADGVADLPSTSGERPRRSTDDAREASATTATATRFPLASGSDDPALAPLDLSDYALETKLGGGGQGEVFLAHQRSLNRRVAVKMLNQSCGGSPQSEQRLVREARTLAQTSHPQIVTIHGIGRSPGGGLFLVMEYVDGRDLAQQIADERFEIRKAVEIAVQIAKAVAHAHSRGVIHRDLKPSNVLWHDVRGPVVTDFGLAKDLRAIDALTLTEQTMGTPTYMAPEQAHRRFNEISERTDVYGLAATLYALLTGHPPIPPGPLAEVLQRLTSDEPVADPRIWRPELPAGLCAVILHGLKKYQAERYGSVAAFAAALQRWLDGAGRDEAAAIPTVPIEPEARPRQRLQPGDRFGRYRLIANVSNDPTRKIFRAEDETGRQVLLKCLPAEWLSDRMRRSQFHQEVLLSCSLSHPCLAKVVEAGTRNDIEFLALELLLGESLSQVLARDGRMSEQRAVDVLRPIAEALHLIHAAGVIYRDLRPQNILLVDDGRPMLADVRFSEELSPDDNVTLSGKGIVTSKYVAPELLLGRASDVATDVYTLGATLYAVVTGREPFCEEPDSINVLIAKNAARFTPPRAHAPDLSLALCDLIAECLRANPAQRPPSAQAFADRLSASVSQESGELPLHPTPDSENLLHGVWDRLDPELQDAFSLAYNKKRRAGSTRISTRDLFEALARLGTGPLKRVFQELPAGSLPEPAPRGIPIDRTVLKERPLLSDCVRQSLGEFRKLPLGSQKVRPVDLFVDVAKFGHGPSVVKLRQHGVDPDAVERIVNQLGLSVIRRETPAKAPLQRPRGDDAPAASDRFLSDENVQFSVYRPKVIPPETWQPLLAFAHLSELPADAPPSLIDPIAEVQRQAEQVLGAKLPGFQSLTSDSSQSVPHSGELTFVPTGDGLEFNPARRSFLWQEPVHREEFRFQAAAHLDGQQARGRLSVYLGRLLIAEVGIVVRVDRKAAEAPLPELTPETRARRFRRIYACVARVDRAIVAEFRRYAELMRDRFMMSHLDRQAAPAEFEGLIRSADVFQLYWSTAALRSSEMEREWQYALSLNRRDFIRSFYWEEPFPTDPARSLPPPSLLALGFQKIPGQVATDAAAAEPRFDRLATEGPRAKLDHVRRPRVKAPESHKAADDTQELSIQSAPESPAPITAPPAAAAANARPTELKPGDRLGPYRLEEQIAAGGHGAVFRARIVEDDKSTESVPAARIPYSAAPSNLRTKGGARRWIVACLFGIIVVIVVALLLLWR